MSLMTMAKFIMSSNPVLLLRTGRLLNEVYRAAFVATAASEGVLAALRHGCQSTTQLQSQLGIVGNETAFASWLDLGVAVGELRKVGANYAIKGRLSRRLADPSHDALLAYLQARIDVILQYVTDTPRLLKSGRRFGLDDSYGELFARSSRTVEPILFDEVDRMVGGARRMLEVGCGAGLYIRRACEQNPELRAVGIELSAQAAELARNNIAAAGLTERCTIEHCDLRDYEADGAFDLATFYNLIYYFPVEQRLGVLRQLHAALAPGGRLVLTSLTQAMDTPTCTMNLWCTMTEGCGALPTASELRSDLTEAGFSSIDETQLIANYWLFTAHL